MDPITIFLLILGIGSALKKAAKWLNWQIGADPGRIMLEHVYETQKDRLEHQYEAQQTRIEETALEVSGQQTAALAALGQAGGEGTVGAGILAHTEARKISDLSLLDTSYQDALADLEAQYNLAIQEQSEELAFDIESSVANLAKIGLGSQSLGLTRSRASLNVGNLLGLENRYYDWGLLP